MTFSILSISRNSFFSSCFLCFSVYSFFFRIFTNFLFSNINSFLFVINYYIESFSSLTRISRRAISDSDSNFSFLLSHSNVWYVFLNSSLISLFYVFSYWRVELVFFNSVSNYLTLFSLSLTVFLFWYDCCFNLAHIADSYCYLFSAYYLNFAKSFFISNIDFLAFSNDFSNYWIDASLSLIWIKILSFSSSWTAHCFSSYCLSLLTVFFKFLFYSDNSVSLSVHSLVIFFNSVYFSLKISYKCFSLVSAVSFSTFNSNLSLLITLLFSSIILVNSCLLFSS
jgi:hypothetical protein